MINDIYYSINNEKIYNPYLAFERGATNTYHQFPKFEFMPGVFDLANIEPSKSFDQLCDQRAHQLRNKYEYLALAFSGGTDSFLVYNSFVRNNIHIDHIICDYLEPACGHDKGVAVWLKNHHPDPKTKISIRACKTLSPLEFSNANWIYENRAVSYRYRSMNPDHQLTDDIRNLANGKSFALMVGFEKPHLLLINQQWYMSFLDHVYNPVMGLDGCEMFFITPDLPALHIKQCHMLIKFLSTFVKPATVKTFFTNPIEHGIDYMQWTRAIGRQGEVVINNSLTQKLASKNMSYQIDTASSDLVPVYTPGLALLHEHNLDDRTNSNNFLKGINDLQTNLLIKKYLNNHGILDNLQSTVFGKYNALYTKPIWVRSFNRYPG